MRGTSARNRHRLERALLHRQQCDLYCARNDYGLARNEYDEASALAEQCRRPSLMADAQFRCGMLLAEQGSLKEAAPYLHRALSLAFGIQAERMTGRIAAAIDSISVDAWLESLLELKRANASLAETKALQEDLASQVVHDLRSPLACIDGTLQLIQSTPEQAIAEDLHDDLERARSLCTWLVELTSSVLDVHKMESGERGTEREELDLAQHVVEVVDWFAPEAAGKELGLRAETDGELPPGLGDSELTRRVLVNLVKNAIKYTPFGRGEIAVAALREPGKEEVRLEVRDCGDGLDEEARARVFSKFGQVSSTKARHSTGIGLYFCKLAVEAQGGRLGVDSEVGKGTTFWFTLPTATTA